MTVLDVVGAITLLALAAASASAASEYVAHTIGKHQARFVVDATSYCSPDPGFDCATVTLTITREGREMTKAVDEVDGDHLATTYVYPCQGDRLVGWRVDISGPGRAPDADEGEFTMPSCPRPKQRPRPNIRLAYRDWRSGLRHHDGTRACNRMTSRLRGVLFHSFAEQGVTFDNCEQMISLYGRDIYNDLGSGRVIRSRVDGSRGYVDTPAGRFYMRRPDGFWLVNGNRP